jgi:hypothetical protein
MEQGCLGVALGIPSRALKELRFEDVREDPAVDTLRQVVEDKAVCHRHAGARGLAAAETKGQAPEHLVDRVYAL